jgi:hypothetical protein
VIVPDVDEFLRVTHQREHHRFADDFQRRKVLGVPQDDRRDAGKMGVLIASRRSAYARSPPLRRNKEIRRLEESIVNLLGLDETSDVDGSALLERCAAEVLFREDDEATLLVLVTLHELIPRHRLAFARADPFEPYRGLVRGVEHAEARSRIADSRVELDGNIDEPEREGAFPESSSHSDRACKGEAQVRGFEVS